MRPAGESVPHPKLGGEPSPLNCVSPPVPPSPLSPPATVRRRLLRLALGVIAASALVLVTLPWWLGLVLPGIARTAGATFSRYERLSTTRFALHEVNLRLDHTTVTVARLEADSPLVWLFRRTFGQPGPIALTAWRVAITPSAAPTSSPYGWLPLRAQLRSISAALRPWLPRATFGPGELTAPGFALQLTAATWENSTLTLRTFSTGPLTADLTLALFPANQDLLQLSATLAHPTLPTRLALESRAATVTGQLTFLDQPAPLTATFAPTGWLPTTATVQADAWTFPGSRLPPFTDYTALRGTARLDWRDAQLALSAAATGEPAPSSSAPPLAAELLARSDGATLQLTSLHVTAPGLRADLSAPVIIDRAGQLLSGDSRFTLTADLAAWPQLAARGTVTGEARVTPGPARLPRADFQLAAKALSVRDWQLSAFTAAGRLDWPLLTLATAALESANGDRLIVTGGYDYSQQTVRDAHVSGRIARATLAPLLPAALDFATLTLDARATGPLNALAHSGNVTVSALSLPTAPATKPLALTATWQGLDRTLASFSATATAGATRLTATGSTTAESITLATFTFGALQLSTPVTLRWSPTLQLSAFNLTTPDASSSLSAAFTLGPSGQVSASAKNFASTTLADLVTLSGPAWTLAALDFHGTWDRGPLTFTTTADATLALTPTQSARLTFAATGDPSGIKLSALNVLAGPDTALRATGQLPFTVTPHASAAPTFSILPDAPLALTATTEPTAAFWSQLQALTGVELVAPQLSAQLTGTWSQPRGIATLRATRLALDPARFDLSLPAVEAVELDLTGDSSGLVLQKFSATLDGQAVRATGRLPVAAGAWTALRSTPLAQLTDAAELHLEIPAADIAALAHHLPDYLAPQGRLALDLTLKPGGNLTGFLRLTAAASRPFGALGAIQDINADLQLSGRTLTLVTLTARTGGQPVTLAGTVTLPRRAPPQLDLTLKGTNLPLARQLGLLLRGDLDLRLTTPAAGPALISGTVGLHDSLFLSDVRDLLPSGERGTSARAPYFSVESAPFDRWQLDVAINGDRFLRLRTALFNGVASARFRLTGTLRDPLALGEITVPAGNVLLPFATFAVRQASLRLTAENPHDPSLFLTATALRAGYDLRLELGGTLSAPVVTFGSSPALDSQQVLLLVMAGQLPSGPGGVSSAQRAARLGTYFGKSLLGRLGGDSAAGDRLNFTTGERISRQGRETFGLEYRLDARWSLVGEYDEFDDYNAGVKWRILAAPVPPAP